MGLNPQYDRSLMLASVNGPMEVIRWCVTRNRGLIKVGAMTLAGMYHVHTFHQWVQYREIESRYCR